MIIAFDVDGTILDTFDHIRATYIEVFETYLPGYKYTEEQIKSFFGPPLPDTFMSVVHDQKLTDFLVEKYREISLTNMDKYLKIYPGVKETLDYFKSNGYKLAVVSNKRTSAILDGFRVVGITDYFDYIIGYDSVKNPKPDPEGIRKLEEYFNDKCILVGDSIFDIETGKNANVPTVGVTWALTTRSMLEQAGADYVIDRIEELIDIVKEL